MTSVPFYANPDDLHCFQATMRSVLKYFLPEKDFSWEQLDKLSAKLPGKATWPQQMLIHLHDMGFAIVMVEGFDGHDFIKRGSQYLIDTFGKETAKWQIEHSDITQEQRLYQQLFDKKIRCENRVPTLEEMRGYLHNGYLLQCTVNSRSLNGQTGYVGHSVLVYDITDDHVVLHDPGPPAMEARYVEIADFNKAWADPDENAQNFIAIKYIGTDHE